ncbi:hypothetical protein AALB16_10610 [Lachnospiraceae bacterium 62-35]
MTDVSSAPCLGVLYCFSSLCPIRAEIDQKGRLRIYGLHKINRYATKKVWVSRDCGT